MRSRLTVIGAELWHYLKRAALLTFALSLMVGATLMIGGGYLIFAVAERFPTTEGKLRRFQLHPLPRRSWSHVAIEVAFDYQVDGKKFSGEHFSPMTRPGKIIRWYAESKRADYQPGDTVRVLYDPKDPSVAYLEAPSLFWDVLFVPGGLMALGLWLLYVFVRTRRRRVPKRISAQLENRFSDRRHWRPVLQTVVDEDHVVLVGTTVFPTSGSLLSGWPSCRTALVATPNEFAVVPGPYTLRGFASSLLTLVLELSLSRLWIPVIHGVFFSIEFMHRRRLGKLVAQRSLAELFAEEDDAIQLVPIDDAIIYGFDETRGRLWYRLPEGKSDEFIRIAPEQQEAVDQLFGYIGLMQQAAWFAETGSPETRSEVPRSRNDSARH
jgi:hypothetical protein